VTVSASSFNVPFEALLDRTAWLHDRMAKLVPGAGATLGAVTAVHVVPPQHIYQNGFGVINGPFAAQQSSTTPGSNVIVPLPRPPYGKILEIQALVKGASGHGALPATKPKCELYRQDYLMTGSGTLVATATDSSATVGAYEAGHVIDLFAVNHTLVGQDFYYLILTGESGANSQTGLLLSGFAVYWGDV
jgi:hypothetical protein